MTEEFLQQLIEKYHVPVHIRRHMQKVAAVALYLGQNLQQAGEKVDLIVVRQAALLHDLMKLCDFKELDLENFDQNITTQDIQFWTALMKSCGDIGHERAAYNVLKELGEDQIAEIVLKHRFAGLIEAENKPKTWEEKLVYYADKRVKHDEVVSLEDRLHDGRERYFPDGNFPENHDTVEKAVFQLESELCQKSHIKPSDINEKSVVPFLET